MKCSLGTLAEILQNNKSYTGVLIIQLLYAGKAMLIKAAITEGLNPYVLVFYRQAFATLALAPFAFFFESKKSTALSMNLLCKIFFVSLVGITLSLNLDCLSLNYISATLSVAISTTLPAITFIIAVFLRMESISIKYRHGFFKVLGSTISLSGALVFIFVKGSPMYRGSEKAILDTSTKLYSKNEWLKGSVIAIACNIAWSLWIIVQGSLVKQYPAILRLTTLQTFFSCIQSALWAAAVERKKSSWKLGWDKNLLSITYCGVIYTTIAYSIRIWVIEKKGPVFLAMFTPLSLLFTIIMSTILWKETLLWGSVGGGLLLVAGLYVFLWGKHEEQRVEKDEQKSNTFVEEIA